MNKLMIRYEFLITDQTSGPNMKGENLGDLTLKKYLKSLLTLYLSFYSLIVCHKSCDHFQPIKMLKF